MKKALWIILALLVVGAAGAAYYLSPYWALNELRKAAEEGNAEALNEQVDFPAVRQNLKDSFNAQMTKEMGNKPDDGWGQAGAAIAMAFSGPIIDAFVTPQNVAAVIRGEEIGAPGEKKKKKPAKPAEPPELKPHYETKDRFVVDLHEKGKEEEKVGLVFRREGLFKWKLYSIRFPEE